MFLENLRFYIRHSFTDLRINGRRTIFAILCITAGVAAVVSLQTLSQMIEDSLTGSLQESNRGDIRIQPAFFFGDDEDDVAEFEFDDDDVEAGLDQGFLIDTAAGDEDGFGGGIVISPSGLETLRAWFDDNGYEDTITTYRQSFTDFTTGFSVSAPDQDTDKTFITAIIIEAEQYPLYGEVATDDDDTLADLLNEPNDIVISQILADDLRVEEGDRIRVAGASEDFIVSGIVPDDAESGFENIVGNLFGYYFLDVSAMQFFPGEEEGLAINVYVRLDNPNDVDEVSAALNRDFPFLNLTTTTDLRELNTEISENIDYLVTVMGFVSLLIGGIGIVNTMLVIVSRRTTEIAVLKTIGLEPQQVTSLFMVEAIIMGIIGSVFGIIVGWILALATQGAAELFVGQNLTFTPDLTAAANGFVIGVVITAIFGFLPTLAAGQIRPANVLRPSENVVPRAGRLRSFVALVVLVFVMTLVTEGLIGNLIEIVVGDNADTIAGIIGAVYGLGIGIPLIIGSVLSLNNSQRGMQIYEPFLWLGLLIIPPVIGFLFGQAVTSLLLVTVTIIFIAYMYITLWLLIWAVGGGRPSELYPGILILGFPLFLPLAIVLPFLLLPAWILGWLIQRYTFIDLKIAMRSMLSTKSRGASALLALVVGIFTLSVITMMVGVITETVEQALIEQAGGNVIIFIAGGGDTDTEVRNTLRASEGVNSFAVLSSYDVTLLEVEDVSAEQTLNLKQLEDRVTEADPNFSGFIADQISDMDARDIESNLPEVDFEAGRQLDPALDNMPDADGNWPLVIRETDALNLAGIEVGDILTFTAGDDTSRLLSFYIVGIVDQDQSSVQINFGNDNYTAPGAFEGVPSQESFAIVDVNEGDIRDLRRTFADVQGTFFLETRLLNDIVNRLIEQFTSFPTLVAGLALFTGGIVIANSVALSTLERRREIGVMKAVGLQRERVLGMLLLENGLMGLIGGLIGVGISFAITVALIGALFSEALQELIPFEAAFILMALCIGIALLAAILSVWGASGEKPLNVLRYE